MRSLAALLYILLFASSSLCQSGAPVFKFAVSGDSRNCGDIIMPAIAQGAKADNAAFYWHLGDFRATTDFDEDYRQIHPKDGISRYSSGEWPDFIAHQLDPFGDMPVYLGLGNHETYPPKTRTDALLQFADWFDRDDVRAQRLKDDPADHMLHGYFHWMKAPVDFINLDNATDDMFDGGQMKWFAARLKADASDSSIKAVVLGMHRALPDSLSCGHSMNDTPQQTVTGHQVYQQLVDFRAQTGKKVYVLASHSHYYLRDIYATACRKDQPGSVLPGWIVGTAGAQRYRLPEGVDASHDGKNDYGYLLGTVGADGSVAFDFRSVSDGWEKKIPETVMQEFGKERVAWCINENHGPYQPGTVTGPPACECTEKH